MDPALREKNLPLVVDNPRFLILPWIRIPNLVRRRLTEDWVRRYGARADRDLRPEPALDRGRRPGFGLAPGRNYPRPEPLRLIRLKTNPQLLKLASPSRHNGTVTSGHSVHPFDRLRYPPQATTEPSALKATV